VITFYCVIDQGVRPEKADKAARGTLPVDGFRYCEPVRIANSFGWYVYLPLDLWLIWDGSEYRWSLDEGESWYHLWNAIQYPDFSDNFDLAAPEDIKGYSPPFVSKTKDPDILQIWSGLFAKTDPGIASLIRSPVNLYNSHSYTVLDGVVQTDWWFGPLFANIRVFKTDQPFVIRRDVPFFQIQPFDMAFFKSFEDSEYFIESNISSFSDKEWRGFKEAVVERMKNSDRRGQYALKSRKL
jgi:hypothetical protein